MAVMLGISATILWPWGKPGAFQIRPRFQTALSADSLECGASEERGWVGLSFIIAFSTTDNFKMEATCNLEKRHFLKRKNLELNLSLYLFFMVKWKLLSCVRLCDPMDYTVHGILQARILEWVAFPFSRASSQPRDQTQVSHIAGRFFTNWAIRKAQEYWSG